MIPMIPSMTVDSTVMIATTFSMVKARLAYRLSVSTVPILIDVPIDVPTEDEAFRV